MARLLLIEDDARISRPLRRDLLAEQHVLDLAEDGQQGWDYLEVGEYDAAIVDILLPGLDGVEICRRARARGLTTPILLLTALDGTGHKIRGLDAGADDYLVKPFALGELHARLRALIRRASGSAPLLSWGPIRLDPARRQVEVQEVPLALTPREYQLLELFLRYPDRAFSSDEILDRLWGWEAPGRGTVKSHLLTLRKKLGQLHCPDPIETVYGRGYRRSHEP